jgi:hypothetical protein
MTEPSPQLRRLLSALVAAQGLALVGIGLSVSSVNLPRAPQRLDHAVVLTLGLGVVALGLLALRLPVQATMAGGSSLLAVMIVFGAGYRPLQRGDLVLTLVDGRVSYRTYESETEWAERYGRTDPRLGRRGIPHAVARHVNRDFTVTYRLDGDGWRRLPAPPAGRAQGEIWFLGCSYTFGVGVEDDEVYVHRLAATAWPQLQVRNFSVPAWGTTNAHLALEDRLAQEPTPRAVVYGWIDDHRRRNYLRKSWFARTNAALIPHFDVDGGELRWLGMAPNRVADVEDGPALDAIEAALSDALIRGMARLARKRGAPFVLLVLRGDAASLAGLRDEPGLHVLDVSHVSGDYHPHDGHPTKAWHEAIAHAIAAAPLMAGVAGVAERRPPDAAIAAPNR